MAKRILIGLGTGRCGTTSLSRLLDSSADCHATHEAGSIRANLSWGFSEEGMKRSLKDLESRAASVACDVAFYHLPYVEYMAETRPDATFICMRRDREETVESYMLKTEGRDHWRVGRGGTDAWDRFFPKFEAPSKREAIGMYWDMYYSEAERLEKKGIKIRTFDISSLNSEEGARSILEFAGLDSSRARPGIRENAKEKN